MLSWTRKGIFRLSHIIANFLLTFSLYNSEMRKSLVLTIIIAILSLGVVTGCALSSPPQVTPETFSEIPKTGFYLIVTQPADGSIVTVDKVEVRGSTSPGAVVSVNDKITMADTQGIFAVTISLEEGPNIIEVVTSDEEGNEATTGLTVTLVKGGRA